MILGAFRVSDTPVLRAFIERANSKLSTTSVLYSGKLSLLKKQGCVYLFFNIRYWLFNFSFLNNFYSWLLVKGLKRAGYDSRLIKLSSVELSKLLEGVL